MTSNYDDLSAFPERPSASPNDSREIPAPPPPPPVAKRSPSPRSIRKPRPGPSQSTSSKASKQSRLGPRPKSAAADVQGPRAQARFSSGLGATLGGGQGADVRTPSAHGNGASFKEGERVRGAKANGRTAAGTAPAENLPDEAAPTGKSSWFSGVNPTLMGVRWLRSWPIVVLIIFGILGASATAAVVSLFRIPNLPNCRAIFWPTASASLRLQCAESYAAQGDVQNLLAAIALVDQLPKDHPLRSDIINDRIEGWANQVLDLAERSFEDGEIDLAIDTAKQIPQRTAAAEVVEERIARWKEIWQEGEDSFNAAVEKLKEKNFQSAFSLSVKLLDVPNKFWATEKYNELTKLISLAREDSRLLSEALGFAKEGTVKGFSEALKRLKDIKEESVFYAEAQSERKKIAQRMLKAGEDLLARQQLSDAQSMLSAIPRDVGLNEEIEDFQTFVTAYQQAWTGTASGLENAITRMKSLKKDRPLYGRAQQLIGQWQGELQDVAVLAQARERASRGSTADLNAAIAIAQQVSQNSPQWEEAADQIGDWRSRVETVQDRPILERADQLALSGTPNALRAAIQEAKKISSGRTLGPEADQRIANWTGRLQRIEDQPLLDQARQRAGTGDRAGAIAIASRIGEGRALYGAAQEDIGRWQTQEDGRQRLGEAVTTAARGDATSLTRAIDIALRVPEGSDSRSRADNQINRWSWDLLRQAEATANRDLEGAIALAGRIPSQSEAYDPAQVRIRNWQATLRSLEEARRPQPVTPPVVPERDDAPREATESDVIDEGDVPATLELGPPE